MLPVVTAGKVKSTVEGGQTAAGLLITKVGVMQLTSPIAKSLNEFSPRACVLVVVRTPEVVVDQTGELYLLTMKLLVFAPASISPAAKLNTAS